MRDVAYWPKTFLDEVEAKKTDHGILLRALGGPSFFVRTPQTAIWLDPYFYGTPDDAIPDAYRAPAIPIKPDEIGFGDIVISTHDHIDHCHKDTLLAITKNTTAFCVGPSSSAKLMRDWGIPNDRIRQVAPGDHFVFRDIEFDVFPSHDPGEPHAVTIVLTSGGVRLFVSGDTSDGPTLAQVGDKFALDYGLLAFGRTWYMSEEQMLVAARKLHPRVLLPFHWEFWRNNTGNIKKLLEIYFREKPGFDIEILLIGDALQLEPRAR